MLKRNICGKTFLTVTTTISWRCFYCILAILHRPFFSVDGAAARKLTDRSEV